MSAAASTVAAAPAAVVADGTASATVTVTLRTASAAPMAGKAVTLSSSRGATDTISAPSGLSDPSGIVTFAVRSLATGPATFTAFDPTDSLTVDQTASVTFTAGPAVAGLSTVTSSPASVTANGTAAATVTVTLRDANGNVVPGKTVTLTSSRGATDAISASGPSTAAGVVTFTVTSTTAGTSTFAALDVTDGAAVTVPGAVAFVPGPAAAGQSTTVASPAAVVADGAATSTVTVTLKDANGNAVPDKTVTLASSRGATDTISAASGPSTTAGVVTFTVKSTTAGSPTFTATDTTDAVTVSQTASVTFDPGPVSPPRSLVAASPASVVADGVATSLVTVTLRDAYDNLVPGEAVTLVHWEWPAVGTTSEASGPSDASGVVTFTVTSTTTGTATLWAVHAGQRLAGEATVTFTPGPVSNARSTVSASAATTFANGATGTTVTVTLRDANGNPVPGKIVTLASSRGAVDTILPVSASLSTNGSGAATFGVGSSAFGSSVFSATDQTDAIPLTQTAPVSFTRYLAFTTQPPASVTAAVAFATAPVVTLQDASGSADPAFAGSVTIAISTNAGGGTLFGVKVVRAIAGVASFPGLSIDRAGTGYTLAAADLADGLPPSASAPFEVVTGPPARLAFTIQPSNTGAGIGPTFQVSILDAGNNPTASTGNPVTVAIGTNPSSGVLTGTATASTVGGVATFTGLGVAAPGTGYTLLATDTPDGLTAATSAAFDVTAPVVVGTGTAGSCTEAALGAALAGGGNIIFSCGASPVTITFTSTKTIAKNTSLDGGGLVTLSGGGTIPLFSIGAGVTAALANLTVSGGFNGGGNGGAIHSLGTLSVTRCTLGGNSTDSSNDINGSPANGGAIYNAGGTLIVASSTFTGNTVHSYMAVRGMSANGGAIFTSGKLLVTNSTFAGNTASASDAYYGTAGNGGAIFNGGGAVAIASSTFSGNGASSRNNFYGTGGFGGALFGGATLTNTIVAGSTAGANCSGAYANGGQNLDSDGSCAVGAATDPLLDPAGLGTHGGPTRTIALQAGSPAIDAGNDARCAAAPVNGVDQRGVSRPGAGATRCSIGAIEHDGS